jgi:metal-responsive CopG/Arc/MetJ family transcriptional regulator
VARAKIAITIDERTLAEVDRLVAEGRSPNRSQAIQQAVDEQIARLAGDRLARECARLDPAAEQALADEGLGSELESWPDY